MRWRFATCLAATVLVGSANAPQHLLATPAFDLAIVGGRVIDPQTHLDAVRNIGIVGNHVAVVTTRPITAKQTIAAHGMIVAPGFIDIHSHAELIPTLWLEAFDGVTTALDMEAGRWPVAAAYQAEAARGSPINYGYSVNWRAAREVLMGDRRDRLISSREVNTMVANVAEGLNEGGLGIGILVGYSTDSNRSEYLELGKLAAARHVATYTHIRYKNTFEPRSVIEGIEEVIAVAAATGAHMHICHLNSSALRETPRAVAMVRSAERAGLPVSTESYPWGAGMTILQAPFLAPENLPLLGIKSTDIEITATGERPATDERLAALRTSLIGAWVVIHYLDEAKPADEAMIDEALLIPNGLIASDSTDYVGDGKPVAAAAWPLPTNAAGHPRTAGTFTRVLGNFVRERHLLSWMEAIRRSSLLPAQLLESAAPAMKRKGRIQPGADADIIVFDPATVGAAATYRHPAIPATGMKAVIVGGRILIAGGRLDARARPGQAVRGRIVTMRHAAQQRS